MKKILLSLAFLFYTGMQIYAQITITGKVTDPNGYPLIGANIIVKGYPEIGTISQLDGEYSISVPNDATTLIFSFIGMQTMEVEINGQYNISIALQETELGIDEVVVSALGIEVDKDKLSGTITSIGSNQIQNTAESGIIQSMSAKTSGINIIQNTGDPGSGAYIQIRGQNTVTGNIQPLIIIDGVPAINSNLGNSYVIAQQSRLNDINPNDIEKIDVLKGASAAAVWGTRAANGVIIITTKTGKGKQKGISVDFSAGFYIDEVLVEHKKQDIFGQGSGGVFELNAAESWGDKIADRAGGQDEIDNTGEYFEAESGRIYYPIINKNSRETFNDVNRNQVLRKGFSYDVNLGVNMKGEKSNTYLSIGNWDQEGILNGQSDYRRTNVKINYTLNPSDRLKFKLNTLYSNISSNRIQQGSQTSGIYLAYLRTSPDFDNTDYKGTYYDDDGVPTFNAHRSYRRYLGDAVPSYSNPGWTLNEMVNSSDVNRIMLSPELQVDIIKDNKISSMITLRSGNDIAIDKRITFNPVNTRSSIPNGSFDEEWRIESEHILEAFARTIHILGNYNFSWIIGGQYSIRNYNYSGGSMTDFINTEDQIYDYSNGISENILPSKYESHKYTTAGYVVLNFDMFDQVFLELTGRTEKSNSYSTSIFYPSASVAWQFTKSLVPENKILTFGKIRASYGTVGVEPPLYIGGSTYVNVDINSRWSDILDAAVYGGGLQRSNIQGNKDLEPERKTEFEVGTDLRLLNNYLTINATYYQNITEGAIFAVDVPASTGYSSKWENAAKLSNKGIELDITGDIIRTENFRWGVNINFSKNKNLVEDLKDVESIELNGHTSISSRAVEGYPLGTFWGGRWERDESGVMVLDANGFPKQALSQGILGDPNPDYRAGLGTTIEFKGVSLGVLFETSQGGDMWAGTYATLVHYGISPVTANEVTLAQDIVNYGGNIISEGTTVRGNLCDFGAGEVLLDEEWYSSLGGYFGTVAEHFIYDASFIRLREITLSYSFPKPLLAKLRLTNASISLIGRNLFLWSDFADNYGVDPQSNLYGASNGRGLDYYTNPSTKSYGFKLSIGF